MERIISTECQEKVGEKVYIKGWLHNFRKLGKIAFLILRDRGGLVQVFVENADDIKNLSTLQPGSIIKIFGIVKENSQAELGFEITNPEITIENAITEPWPVEVNKPEINAHIDTILDYRPLTLRNEKISAVFKIQAAILEGYREYLISQGFTEFMGPAIIGASSEGGAELFTVDYFGVEAKLAQSNQLYKQMMVGVFERVFGTLKCFRAEKSNTRRHITEATQFEFEVGFIEKFDEVLEWEEKVIKAMYKKVLEKCAEEIKLFPNFATLKDEITIPKVTLKEALELYFEATGKDERNENDLSPDAERFICKYAKEKFGIDFIFVTHFPRTKCAFYAKPNEENPLVCNYGDLICNGTEVSSGGQRIDKYDDLVESLKMKGLNPEDFTDYLSIFKYGMPKHGGFGIGLERFTLQLLGLENIRETVLFPSDTKRIAGVPIKRKFNKNIDVTEQIKKHLDKFGFKYEYDEHEEVVTSEDASRVRGTKIEEGAKALIVKGKKSSENFMFVMPAHLKLDMTKAKEILGEAIEFEKPEVILEKFGIQVGGVPPLGNLLGLKTYFDEKILNNETVDFNCGKRTCSIEMKAKDLVDAVNPILGDFSV